MQKKKHYFKNKLSAGFVSLYTSKSIIRIASGLLGVFLPVFLYDFFDGDIALVAWWYIAGSVLYFLLVGPGAMFMNKFGFRRALRMGSVFGALFFATFFFAENVSMPIFVLLSLITLTLQRMFHWIPYHIDFAKFTNDSNRGRSLGLLAATTNVIGVFAPFVAGFILSRFGFSVLFFVTIVIYTLSIIPLMTIPRTHEKFDWSYFKTWKEFFSKKKEDLYWLI